MATSQEAAGRAERSTSAVARSDVRCMLLLSGFHIKYINS